MLGKTAVGSALGNMKRKGRSGINKLSVCLVCGVAIGGLIAPGATAQEPQFLFTWGSGGSGDGQFSSPAGVVVDSLGNVYVADQGNDRVQKFDSSGAFITKWGSSGTGVGQFNGPAGIAVDVDDSIYVTDIGNDRVQKFDSSGNFITEWGSTGAGDEQFNQPAGIAVDSLENVYVTDAINDNIQKFDSSGNFISKWGSTGAGDGQFDFPLAVGIDGADNVYVADTGNDRVQVFDSSGTFLFKWGSFGAADGQFSAPSGFTFDMEGNVYVADAFNGRVQMFDSGGNLIAKWGSFGVVSDVASDEDGFFYVTDLNNLVVKWGPSQSVIDPAGDIFVSTDVPKAIPDLSTITSAIVIPAGKAIEDITDVDVIVDITHTWVSDLEATLESPMGTVVQLFSGVGGSGDDFDGTRLDDEANQPIGVGSAPFIGSFQPEGSLSDFDGESPLGTWTLTITDTAGGDIGTLNDWSLEISDGTIFLPAASRWALLVTALCVLVVGASAALRYRSRRATK